MSIEPANEPDQPEIDPDGRSDAMKDQLRSDVTSWMTARSEAAVRPSTEPRAPVATPPTPKAASRAKQAKAAAASQSAVVKKKPFGMSYDGMSQADYITYMISRGAR